MRRIRLTHIGLDFDGLSFPEGADLVVGEDVSEAVAALRVAAGTAEVLDDDGVTFAFVAAAEAWTLAAAKADAALTVLLDLVEAGGAAERRWFFDLKSEAARDGELFGRRITGILAPLGQDEDAARNTVGPEPADPLAAALAASAAPAEPPKAPKAGKPKA